MKSTQGAVTILSCQCAAACYAKPGQKQYSYQLGFENADLTDSWTGNVPTGKWENREVQFGQTASIGVCRIGGRCLNATMESGMATSLKVGAWSTFNSIYGTSGFYI